MKKFLAILVAAAVSATIFSSVIQTPTDQALVSGTIRWVNSTTWTVLDDAYHEPTGIASATLMSDRVRVTYDFTATEVGSCQVSPDEAFASSDVRVGASVGLTYMDIFFYMPSYGTTPVPPSLLSKSNANVWITCLHLIASQ